MSLLRFPCWWLCVLCAAWSAAGQGFQKGDKLNIDGGSVEYVLTNGTAMITGGAVVRYGNTTVVAERASVDERTGWVVADGAVRIESEGQLWVGEHISYNFKTRQMTAEQFRTGKAGVYAAAENLRGDTTNNVYRATDAYVTLDDATQPFEKLRASSVRIIAGERIEARNAVLYLGGIPVFYLPYYSRALGPRANHWLVLPGYRNDYGAFLVGIYQWYLGENVDGQLYGAYRTQRGPEIGGKVNADLGRWGTPSLQASYLYDRNPENNAAGQPYPSNRGITWLGYQSEPWTNLFVKSQVRYASDAGVLSEFHEALYRQDPQPNTYFNVEKLWQNWSLGATASPRINDYLNAVERLPEVQLTGLRQQLGLTPVYYQSQSSAGYLERVYAVTPGLATPPQFSAARADTWQQLVVPHTFFGFLAVEPRVGGRYTHYTEATGGGATTTAEDRWVFNTGAEVNFKASRVWPGATSQLLDVDGVRHIMQPWANYAYIPDPSVPLSKLPQFDYLTPALSLLPIEFPDYTAIDDVSAQNVVRLGVNNRFQTKRNGKVETLLNSTIYVDSYLSDRPATRNFSDIYAAFTFRPRSWLTLESQSMLNPNRADFDLNSQTLTLSPNTTWSFGFSYYRLRPDYTPLPTSWGPGNQIVAGTIYYRFNQEWGLRVYEYYDLQTGKLADQAYSIYRDFRSWTGALIARIRQDEGKDQANWSVGFAISLKAYPSSKLGEDAVGRYGLLGY